MMVVLSVLIPAEKQLKERGMVTEVNEWYQ